MKSFNEAYRALWTFAAVVAAGAFLLTLEPQQPHAQFSAQSNWIPASGVSGSANAVSLSIPNISSLSDITGVPFSFLPTGANAAGLTTINPSGLGNITLRRASANSSGGIVMVPVAGGDLSTGVLATVTYDGTQFVHNIPATGTQPVGTVIDVAMTSCPAGFLEANAQAQSSTTYAQLFANIGTTWGTSAGNVVVPDLRGRAVFSRDSGGSGRITAAGGNFDGTVVGNAGGAQNHTLTVAELATHNHTLTDPGHTHGNSLSGTGIWVTSGVGLFLGQPGSTQGVNTLTISSATTGITINPAGTNSAHTILDPAAIGIKCIKY
jgi:microcystin-dependent protein